MLCSVHLMVHTNIIMWAGQFVIRVRFAWVMLLNIIEKGLQHTLGAASWQNQHCAVPSPYLLPY